MGRAQRQKGSRGELEVRDTFRAAGFGSDRTPNSGGLHIPADLSVTYMGEDCGFHIESKRQERVRIKEWIAQAEEDAPEGSTPIVAWRTSWMPWRADIDLEVLVRLLAELHYLRRYGGH